MKSKYKFLVIGVMLLLLTSCGKVTASDIPTTVSWADGFSSGWFDGIFVFPIATLLTLISKTTGNVVIGIVLTTFIVKGITMPITIKSQLGMQKIQEITPKQQAISEKYKNRKDQQSQMLMQQELQKLYRDNKVNPLSSILLQFAIFPFFIAMWRAVIRSEIVYHGIFQGVPLDQKPIDLIMQDQNLMAVALLIIMGVTQYLSMKISMHYTKKRQKGSAAKNQQGKQMQKTLETVNIIFVPMMMVFVATTASAMAFYFIASSVFTIFQSWYIQQKYFGEKA